MLEIVTIDEVGELAPGASQIYTVGEREVAVFNIDGALFAIDDRCPHSGASLGLGTVEGHTVTCPWHGWKFDLQSGGCVGRTSDPVRCFPVSRDVAGRLLIDVTPTADEAAGSFPETAYTWLVRYGAPGWVSRFGSDEQLDCVHGDRLLVKTTRGLEVGEFLSPAVTTGEAGKTPHAGTVVRRLTPDELAQHRQGTEQSQGLLEVCQRLIEERSLAIDAIDCESLFDRETIVVYFLGAHSAGLDELAQELTRTQGLRIVFQPLVELEPAPREGGCGSGGGGCQSGGCGSGH